MRKNLYTYTISYSLIIRTGYNCKGNNTDLNGELDFLKSEKDIYDRKLQPSMNCLCVFTRSSTEEGCLGTYAYKETY